MESDAMELTRRELLRRVCAGTAGLAGTAFLPASALGGDDALALVEKTFGRAGIVSNRVRLTMPSVFPTGYTVPMDIAIDTAMTEDDHVKRRARVRARQSVCWRSSVSISCRGRSAPRVSTRIRLAKPQFVVAVAEMGDGALLVNKTWVDVATDGCA